MTTEGRGAAGGGADDRPLCIWCNAGNGARGPALLQILRRLTEAERRLRIVLTASRGVILPDSLPARVEVCPRPVDLRQTTDRFLAEWAPRLALFAGMDFLPSAVPACSAAEVDLILLDARVDLRGGLRRRLADLRLRARIRHFDHIFAASAEDALTLRRMGAERGRVEVLGPLEEGAPALPCNEAERSNLADLLAARPVWVAAGILVDEFDAIEPAHRAASRLSHRLLLIVVPDRPEEGPGLAARFRSRGWTTGLRSEGDEPDPDVQVYVADAQGELGLWYRLAPVSFLGASLSWPGGGHDPYAAAALGSAIITGPYMHRHGEAAARLLDGGACQRVEDSDALGVAVTALLSPDRAAQQANRAWEIASQGAEASDRAVEVILSRLRSRD